MTVFSTVVLTLDGTPLSEQAIPPAIEMSKRFEAPIVVVRVAAPPMIVPDAAGSLMPAPVVPSTVEVIDAEETAVDDYLKQMVSRFADQGITITAVNRFGDPVNEIVAVAGEHPSPLVVMATHARSGMGRLLFGSVAEAVLRNCYCPVLMIHGKD